MSGVASFGSYRDPGIAATCDAFAAAPSALRDVEQAQVEQVIVGTIGDLDSPLEPQQEAATALARHLRGWTQEDRQRYRDEVLGATSADFARIAGALEEAWADVRTAVVSSSTEIEEYMKLRSDAGDWERLEPMK